MDPHVIAEMLSFNDDARQFLNLLHRQRAMSSRSIAAARESSGLPGIGIGAAVFRLQRLNLYP